MRNAGLKNRCGYKTVWNENRFRRTWRFGYCFYFLFYFYPQFVFFLSILEVTRWWNMFRWKIIHENRPRKIAKNYASQFWKKTRKFRGKKKINKYEDFVSDLEKVYKIIIWESVIFFSVLSYFNIYYKINKYMYFLKKYIYMY